VRSHQINNLESARVSFPGQLKRMSTDETATSELDRGAALIDASAGNHVLLKPKLPSFDELLEEGEGDTSLNSKPPPLHRPSPLMASHDTLPPSINASSSGPAEYTWRIDLNLTAQYWAGWFQGMSEKFLSVHEPKLLLVAGVDRLDTPLTVAQMQGKFQFQVLPKSGHAVHEDQPEKVSAIIAQFLTRYRFATSKGKFEKSFPPPI
ncbi:Protein phosphatase methylesterase 1, partial [Cichlidogyrus casuarinus]